MLKKLAPALLAVVIALGSFAFKAAPLSGNFLADNWYTYTGSGSNQNLAASYILEGPSHTACPESDRLCSIKIVNDDGTLTNAEVQALINSENGNTTSTTFPAQSARVDFKE